MEEGVISSGNKKILFIGLFIVPFLAGMALIFTSKGIGTLPYLKCNGEFQTISYKDSTTCLYEVPIFDYTTLNGERKSFNSKDSMIYVVNLYPKSQMKLWEKNLQYNRKIMERYSNCKVLSILESDSLAFKWSQNPDHFFSQFPNWIPCFQTSKEFNISMDLLKVEISDSTGFPPFIIIDKERHLRVRPLINDAKQARDIPKLLKILNNQYAPRKIEVERRD